MRIVRRSPVRGPSVPKKTLQERMAQQAAIERAKCRYIPLECGHYIDLETNQLYSNWRPKRGVTYCEQDSKWVSIAKPPSPIKLPEDPLF